MSNFLLFCLHTRRVESGVKEMSKVGVNAVVNGVVEEVLAKELQVKPVVFPPAREVRGGRAEEQAGIRGQVGEDEEGEELDVLKDADKPHLPTPPLPGVLEAEDIQSLSSFVCIYLPVLRSAA